MASTNPLEDMLTSEVDESAISALVGSLESQLSSPTIHVSSQDITSSSVTNNHVNSVPVGEGALPRLHDGQKHGIQGNSVIMNSDTSKSLTTNSQILGVNSIVSTSATPTNTITVTLAGAVPASGYINQVTSASTQQALINSAASIAAAKSGGPEIKIVYPPQTTIAHFPTVNVANVSTNVIQAPRGTGVPNGNATVAVTKPVQSQINNTAAISAMQNLASVAAQQQPLHVPNSQQGKPQQTTGRLTVREQLEQKQQEKLAPKPQTVIKQEGISASVVNVKQEPPTQDVIATTQTSSPSNVNVLKSGAPTPTVITVSKPGQLQPGSQAQPVNVVTQVVSNPNIIQGVQIVNVNPVRSGAPGTPGQKTLAPRVVLSNPVRISSQLLGARPGTPGTPGTVPNTITLQPNLVRGTLLVKTENGQYQLVSVGPTLQSQNAGNIPGTSTYRLQTVQQPGSQNPVRTIAPQQMTVTLPSNQQVKVQQAANHAASVPTSSLNLQASLQQPTMATASVVTTSASAASASTQNAAASQMSPDTAKKKCKNFLSTLLRLASDQPEQVATNVKNLIQGLIDGNVQPEDFTNQLQKELNSSPQPCLVPFLKKSLPYLRHSLVTRELAIEGVRPPPPSVVVTLPATPATIPQIQVTQARPNMPAQQAQVRLVTPGAPGTITAQITQGGLQGILPHRFPIPHMKNYIASYSHMMDNGSERINKRHQTLQPAQRMAAPNLGGKSILTGQALRTMSPAAMSPATVGAIQRLPLMRTALQPSSPLIKEKEKRTYSSTLRDDDDINDVAAMGGVNLVEESARILAANAEFVGTQIRSCKDENFLFTGPLQRRIKEMAAKWGLEEPLPEVAALISHATQERLKTLVEKLGVIAEHRLDIIKTDTRYEVTQDVKGQLKFLEELDRLEKKRHEEQEREILMRAAKSRSKIEDPEQIKLKQKAKEMQRAEMEEMRQREANMTALLAIGPRKKMRTDSSTSSSSNSVVGNTSPGLTSFSSSTARPQMLRPRVKRVNLRDLIFLLEQERETCRSVMLYKAFLK